MMTRMMLNLRSPSLMRHSNRKIMGTEYLSNPTIDRPHISTVVEGFALDTEIDIRMRFPEVNTLEDGTGAFPLATCQGLELKCYDRYTS
jgi:hypothetical protein